MFNGSDSSITNQFNNVSISVTPSRTKQLNGYKCLVVYVGDPKRIEVWWCIIRLGQFLDRPVNVQQRSMPLIHWSDVPCSVKTADRLLNIWIYTHFVAIVREKSVRQKVSKFSCDWCQLLTFTQVFIKFCCKEISSVHLEKNPLCCRQWELILTITPALTAQDLL